MLAEDNERKRDNLLSPKFHSDGTGDMQAEEHLDLHSPSHLDVTLNDKHAEGDDT